MSRVFAAVGVLFVLLAAAVVAGFVYLAQKGRKLDQEAAAYSVESVAAITAHWDAAALRARASPQLEQSVPPDRLGAMFAWFATLGPLQDQPACEGSSSYFGNSNGTSTVIAKYTCDGHYKAGEAAVSLGLIKLNGLWRISGFHVTSSALVAQNPGQPI